MICLMNVANVLNAKNASIALLSWGNTQHLNEIISEMGVAHGRILIINTQIYLYIYGTLQTSE